MSDIEDAETLSLIHAHAREIAAWRITSCVPDFVAKLKTDLRERAERLHGLVLALVGPAPKVRKPRKIKAARLKKKVRARR